MGGKTAVVAIGGNSLIKDKLHQSVRDQYIAAGETCWHVAAMIRDGWNVAIGHGNGPQVGFILRRSELAAHELHEVPLDVCGADSQGAIGYALQQNLQNDFARLGMAKNAVTVVTQVEVAVDDPAFVTPSKPIGSFMDESTARRRESEDGWAVALDADRGWRRVVASPDPLRIVEQDAVKALMDEGFVVITVGGGGIPVVRDATGDLSGVAAVIDKDLASALLATVIGAELFVISTSVEKVALRYGTPQQEWIDRMTLSQARTYLEEGVHFAGGSMAPKIGAVIRYLERGGGEAIITDPENVERALRGDGDEDRQGLIGFVPGRSRTMSERSSFIEGLPKAELHLHIEGTLEPELKFELAARNGLELPYGSVEEMRASYRFHDLPSFLAVYYEGMGVLLHEPDFYDLAMAYFQKAHSQGVVYAEIFFDPQAHTSRGVPFDVVIDGLHRARGDAEASLGLRTQLIMCFLRDMSADSAMQTLEASLPYRDRIVGVGLDSDEKGNPPNTFREVFARARAEGYHLTMHCDVDQENSTEHIRQCLDEIGVERIDHGTDCLKDPSLVEEIARRGLGLTVCPISNTYAAGGLKGPEIRALIDRGVRVTINSDDPAYFAGYVAENYEAVQEALGLTRDEIVGLARNAFAIAWLTDDERSPYLEALDRYARAA